MISKVGYFLYVSLSWVIWALPLPIAYAISDIFYFILYLLVGYRKKVVRQNLTNSFPEKSLHEIKQIERRFFHHLCDIFIESMMLLHLTDRQIKERFKFNNIEIFDHYHSQGRNAILVMGHYCNWEMFSSIPLWSNYHALGVYKRINNAYFNSKMKAERERFGGIPVEMKETLRQTFNYIKAKKQVVLGLISDQSPIDQDSNYWVNFLNQETGFFLGPEKLAKKFNMVIIFPYVRKVKRGYYEIDSVLVCDNPSELPDGELTKIYIRMLENQIKEMPDYWLWSHRRWKRAKPSQTPLHSLYE